MTSPCPTGTYMESSLCVACPGGQTTASGGATSASECDFCAAGSYLDATSSLCVACPAGFLKGVVEDAACTPCPGGNTSLVGATSASECYCPAGSYFDSLCVDCPEGLHSSLGATSAAECYWLDGGDGNHTDPTNSTNATRGGHAAYVESFAGFV